MEEKKYAIFDASRASGARGPLGRLANLGAGRHGPLYLLVSIGLLCLSLYVGQQQIEFCKRAKHITATVTGHSFESSHRVSLVEFQYNGKSYGHDLFADGNLEEGDEVPVLIEPDNPQVAIINHAYNLFVNAFLLAAASLFFGFLSLVKFRDFTFWRSIRGNR